MHTKCLCSENITENFHNFDGFCSTAYDWHDHHKQKRAGWIGLYLNSGIHFHLYTVAIWRYTVNGLWTSFCLCFWNYSNLSATLEHGTDETLLKAITWKRCHIEVWSPQCIQISWHCNLDRVSIIIATVLTIFFFFIEGLLPYNCLDVAEIYIHSWGLWFGSANYWGIGNHKGTIVHKVKKHKWWNTPLQRDR